MLRSMALSSGTRVGPYEIVAPVGAGGMGEVYRARDPRLNRDVAIKVLSELVSSELDALRRFEQEARSAAALNHPNILAIYQMGTYEGVPYLVSELLEGHTLQEGLRIATIPLRKAIDYAVQIANGLAAAHEKGIVHRDLKPGNLFITKEGRVKILDFGLAKLRQPEVPPTSLAPTVTMHGMIWGTPGYMSPEQVRGQASDHRSDIFAFGAILYEMLLGKRAFEKATTADTMSAVLNEEPPSISHVAPNTPVALQRIVNRCLEKEPEHRFQSASDLAFALGALSDSTIPLPTGSYEKKPDAARGLRLAMVGAALMAGLNLAILGYLWVRTPREPRISKYVQLTHDGQPKSLVGTDGSRLYLGLGVGSSGSFTAHGIAEMPVSGGELRRISITPSPDMVPIGLSAGGTELLVVDGRGSPPRGPLWSLPLVGGSPRRLGDTTGQTAAWSPDGKMLAYANLNDLFLANADGTEPRKLVSTKGNVKYIVWSPDGSGLRFDTTESTGGLGQQLVWEVSVLGTGVHRLFEGLHDPPDECCGRWSADGNYFVFQSNKQIWVLPQKSSFLHSEAKPLPLTFSPLSLSSPLPSRDGKKVFVIGQMYRGELMRHDSKSGQFLPFLGGISAEYLDFSKDGQWVAYVSYPEGSLLRSKVDGSELLQLTYPPLHAMLPRWSPDGKKIVFFEFGSNSGKPARIYVVSSEGGSAKQLLPDDLRHQLDPTWSPDGDKIVFGGQSNDPTSAIHILDLASSQVSDLPDSQGFYSPRWSPNRRYIAAFPADSMRLMVFDLANQRWTELASGSFSWLNWSRNGQYLYVLDSRGRDAVLKIRISDHKSEQVADLRNFLTVGQLGGSLALAPDDSPLLLHDAGTRDVYALDWTAP